MTTLISRIERAATTGRTVHFVSGDDAEAVGYDQLHADARAMAAALQARGVEPGDHVSILGPTSRALVTCIEATLLAGAAVVALPLPMRLASIEEFVDQTRRRVRAADSRILVVDADLAPFVEPEPGDPPMVTLDALTGDADDYVRPADDPTRLAILQFTSGSTSDPKGVMLPDAQVRANLDGIATAAHLDPDDVLVSWLPLYHDMGLIGILFTALTNGLELVLSPPTDFLGKPSRWMNWISEHGGTVTAGPNFSYALAARALRRGEQLDLSSLRMALNGAEPIDPADVERFVEAGDRHGLRPEAVFCAFGMAEATLAVTFPEPLTGLGEDVVDRVTLEAERYAAPANVNDPNARRFARCGTVLPGLQIRVVDLDDERLLGEREVGELQVRGASVTTGYYAAPDATAAAFDGEWLRTGDLAYLVDGELVVCGRIKDVIIVGGRNVFPEDVERAVNGLDGVRRGNVIAFGAERSDGREGVVVVAETKSTDSVALAEDVQLAVRGAIGVPVRDVVLVNPGTLPKTSSGKLQRSLCRQRYLTGVLG
ncbi:MAG: fatty acyl-AMP ligase [Actinomycetota bacterium]